LWSATGGVVAIMTSLNAAYDVTERRPIWKRYGIAIALTIAISLLIIAALGIILFGGRAAEYLAAHVGFGPAFVMTWKIVQWPVAFVIMAVAFALLYYFGPDVETHHWYWITPGSLLGVLIWLLSSVAVRIYLHFFNTYAKTYGSLG